MPQRTLDVLLALAGVLAVAAIALLGCDLYRAARTGPRWKRRLVGAGLALLAALGLPACQDGGQATNAAASTATAARPAKDLPDTPEWKRLAATWREAEETASGKRGPYPFNERGKERLLGALADAGADVDALKSAGHLTAAEAGLLRLDLAELTRGVQAKRPTEMRMATCYEPMAFTPAQDSLKRLSARAPLLEKLAAADKLQPDVARKVLAQIEQDLAVLAQKQMIETLPEAQRPGAEQLRQAAAARVRKVRATLSGERPAGDLESSADWTAITDGWAFAMPLAKSGKSTTAQRKVADAKLKAASEAAERLAEAGLLAPEEAQLLVADAASIRQDIYREPPTDSRVLCYDMAYLPPARRSLEGLAYRLPLVQKLVARGTIHASAAARIVAAMEADLAVLADPKETAKLPQAERQKAEDTRRAVEAELAQLKARLQRPAGTAP